MKRRKKFHKKIKRGPRKNRQIWVSEVQLIDEEGNKIGVTKTFDALRMAIERGLDLVEISPKTRPPIAKIMDFGKFMYQKEKRERSGGKKTVREMKTTRIGLRTGEHDLAFKAKQASGFLKKKHSVRIEIFLRGRENRLKDMAREKIKQFPDYISEPHIIEGEIKKSPRGFTILLRPIK